MPVKELEAGATYRLRRDLEVRDDQTGTLKEFIKKGTIITIKKVAPEEDQVFIEGVKRPVSPDVLAAVVDPA